MSKIKNHISIQVVSLILIFVAGFIIRYLGLPTHTGDMDYCLVPWFDQINNMTIKESLSSQVGNYGALYQMLILILTRLPGQPMNLIKMSSIVFDIPLSLAVYYWMLELTNQKKALIAMGVTFLFPTVWINSAFWGQCDAIYVSFILWGLYALYKKRKGVSYILFGVALAFKLQTVFIFPFVGYLILRDLHNEHRITSFKHLVKEFLLLFIIPLTGIILAIPNFIAGKSFSDFIAVYIQQSDTYHEMYMNYPGIWALTSFSYDTFKTASIFITFTLLLCILYYLIKNREKITNRYFIWCAFLLSYTCVLCLPAMHDRYGFLYEILAIILVFSEGEGYLRLLLMESITFKTYLYYIFKSSYDLKLLSILNIVIYLSFLYTFYKKLKGENKPFTLLERLSEEPASNDKLPIRGILVITGIFFLIGVFRIGSMHCPENGLSFMDTDTDHHEIVLRFDRTVDFDKIMIFNGEVHNGTVSAFAAQGDGWVKIADSQKIERVFRWNQITFSQSTWNIDLIIHDLHVREIVFVDKDGNTILPDNASDYPELFDEQSTYSNPPTYYNETMFDEVYHGRTAYEFLHRLNIYENTHPPLGKTIIALGISIFGMNPFGWRIMSLIFGTLLIPVMCLFVFEISNNKNLTFLSGILLGTEFMHFTLSRIATIDIFVAFFVLCMFYGMLLFVKNGSTFGLIISGLSSAFAVATKWTGLYAMAGIGLVWFIWFILEIKKRLKNSSKENVRYFVPLILKCIALFIILPVTVYVLSYIPFVNAYPEKGLIAHAIENSQHMLSYHEGVHSDHPYMSSWYSWLINWRPLLDSYDSIGDNVSTVATFMNPVTCILGLCCLPYQLYLLIKKKDKIAGILLILYMAMLAPWIIITRTVFIYQYFICSLVLNLTICYSIKKLRFENESKVIKIIATSSTLLFLLYYPVISGLPVAKSFIVDILQFMPKWVL